MPVRIRPTRESEIPCPAGESAIGLTGRRAGPPEDCGGIWGHDHLVEILADPDPGHEEHEERLEWFGRESADEIRPRHLRSERVQHRARRPRDRAAPEPRPGPCLS
ncbi:IS1096 element passenger TnpR family protein [Kitasatospora sp. NPDC001132]